MPKVTAYVSAFNGENDSGKEYDRKPLQVLTPAQIIAGLVKRGWEVIDSCVNETCLIRPIDCRMVVVYSPHVCAEVPSVA